jgi:hypothetical protein
VSGIKHKRGSDFCRIPRRRSRRKKLNSLVARVRCRVIPSKIGRTVKTLRHQWLEHHNQAREMLLCGLAKSTTRRHSPYPVACYHSCSAKAAVQRCRVSCIAVTEVEGFHAGFELSRRGKQCGQVETRTAFWTGYKVCWTDASFPAPLSLDGGIYARRSQYSPKEL